MLRLLTLHFAICTLQFAIALSPVPCFLSPCSAQDDPFAAGVRTTPWQSPADEQKAFKLPPGFEVNLVAAEPDIQKPLNMAFDERGRIWLACTVEYPYAAPADRPGRDSIRVLEDTDGDGRFENVTNFADGLNIPIGIYPYKGGCVAFSIPNIWHFEDTDGDGVCDKRTVLYGPFDTSRDTHGMVNSFRRGFDGWIYACHGFNNDSRVKGRDGHEVHMQSGNTFRFKLDGSRIEHFTHGQVNPFGMCFDELFNIFTADCHSKPLTQLLRGGYYPSFGKPHDGLGFVPSMMEHSHGSTAICGVAYYTGENFPPEYRGLFYSGNVMTSRINCNKPQYHGSTIKAIEQPDFLSTSDAWFRPVDIHIGAGGAMYILDFYNRIIGHYEVPLPHPGRDRTSGRIWRVAYRGQGTEGRGQRTGDRGQETGQGAVGNALRGVPGGGADLTKLTIPQLIDQLDSPQLEHRLRVQNYLADAKGKECLPQVADAIKGEHTPRQEPHLFWLLERFEPVADGMLTFWTLEVSRDTRVHILKILAEREKLGDAAAIDLAFPYLDEKDGTLGREAALVLGRHERREYVDRLVGALVQCPKDDLQRRQSLRIALRDCVAGLQSAGELNVDRLNKDERALIADICAAVPTAAAAAILIRHLETMDETEASRLTYVQHAARHAANESIDSLVSLARAKSSNKLDVQGQIIQALATGLVQRGGPTNANLQSWGEDVASKLLAASPGDAISWTAVPIDGKPPSANPWVIAARPSRDGDKDSLFYYSLPKGEQRTGIYRSGVFELPAKLSFFCAGHSGFPGQPLNDGNYVRLRDAKTHELLAESRPPRNDVARRFEWDLTKHAGKQGYVELVDGDTASAYAWLAVGRFSLAALNPSDTTKKQTLAAEIVGKLKLKELRPHLATLLAGEKTDPAARGAIAQALVSLDPDARAAALAAALADPSIPTEMRPRMGYAITVRADAEYLENLREVMKRAPSRLQAIMADALAGDPAGATALITLVESGHAAPRLLLLPNIAAKLQALKVEAITKRAAELTASLPPASETIDRLLLERRVAFAKAAPNLERGLAVFTKHCANCHQVAGKGAVVGPQLDGIGLRGLDRLLEDTLDPNRNVDVAFRTSTIRTKDGQVLTGLVRREEGPQLILADSHGKEITLAKAEIDAQQKTALSLMPANVSEVVTGDEFLDLIGYLLSQRAEPAKK
jgi:putative heme-binding domain-containing protein